MTATSQMELAGAPEEDKRVILLVDLSALFWSSWHASGGDEVSSARRKTIERVHACIGDNRHRLIAICCDSGKSFRRELYPEYKANRPEKDLQVLGELEKVKEALAADGFLLWEAVGVDASGNPVGFEADDIIATACREAVTRGHPVVIASHDKDLLQLLTFDGVKALRTHNMKVATGDDVTERFGVSPDKLGDWLALVGDASDNIKGAPGIGEKKAAKLLATFSGLTELLDASDKAATGVPVAGITPTEARALSQNRDVVLMARKLIELRYDAPIDFNQIFETRKTQAEQRTPEESDMDTPDPAYTDGGKTTAQAQPAGGTNGQANGTANGTATPPKPETVQAEMVDMKSTAIARVVSYEKELEPTSLGVAFKLAGALWESRLYSRFPSKEAIAAVIIRGRELGLGALTALDTFHVVEGRPAPHAHFIVSLAEQHPDCEYFMQISSDNEHAEYETKNRKHPKPVRHRYTIADAVDAGMCRLEIEQRDWNAKDGKDRRGNWDKRRAEMIRKTCAVQLVRIVYPYAAMGLYSISELGGEE